MERKNRVLLAVAVGVFIVTFDGAAVQMALPLLHSEMLVSVNAVQWAMTSFLLVGTAGLLPAGHAGDVYGHARVWRAGLVLFIFASAACAVTPGFYWLVGARALQGLGAAMASANSAPLIVAAFPRASGRALGLGNIAIAIGLVAGPPIGAVLSRAVSWRLIFAVAPPIGLLGLLLARGRLPAGARRTEALHLPVAVLSALGLAGVLVAGTFGHRWGWTSPATLVPLGAGALLIAIFFALEARAKEPLLDLTLFRRRVFLSGNLAAMCAYAALFSLTVAMPFFLLLAQHRTIARAGLIVGVVPLALSSVAPLSGMFADRVGSRGICVAAQLCIAASLALLVLLQPGSGLPLLIPALTLAGIGFGGFEAPNSAATIGSLDEDHLAVGTATLNTLRQLGMTLGGALAATLIDVGTRTANGETPDRVTAGVHLAMIAGAVAAALGAVAAALRPPGPSVSPHARARSRRSEARGSRR